MKIKTPPEKIEIPKPTIDTSQTQIDEDQRVWLGIKLKNSKITDELDETLKTPKTPKTPLLTL